MFNQKLNTIGEQPNPVIGIGFLVAVSVFTMFAVGYDQGQLFSVIEGQGAFDTKWIHEFTHDMRHAGGFPCH